MVFVVKSFQNVLHYNKDYQKGAGIAMGRSSGWKV